jgi:hypothetical protein
LVSRVWVIDEEGKENIPSIIAAVSCHLIAVQINLAPQNFPLPSSLFPKASISSTKTLDNAPGSAAGPSCPSSTNGVVNTVLGSTHLTPSSSNVANNFLKKARMIGS